MTTIAHAAGHAAHPVHVYVEPALTQRNRLTTAFRLFLAIPHILLVGAPVAATWAWHESSRGALEYDYSAAGGVLGAVALVCAFIAWFSLMFTSEYPDGLRNLVTFYLRCRVRAVAYMALLRDEYPPFGDAPYHAWIEIGPLPPPAARNRLSIAFRLFLVIPHAFAIWALGLAWAVTSIIAWFSILFTGEYPARLYHFAVGVLQWTTRVEAYVLLLHDDYPPFAFD